MRDWNGKRYWVIGASEGLGRALAQVMSRAGVELVLSARSEDRLHELAGELPGRSQVVPLDAADSASVRRAAAAAGEIDGLVWLAGAYWPMKATEWDADKAETIVDTNLTGAVRAIGAVLPGMVAKGAGHIVLTGSISGFRGLPGAVGYSASKAGLYSLAETMYLDLKDSGVEVQIVNPGYIHTRLTEKNDFRMPAMMEPEQAAREMFEHIGTDSFAKSFPFWFSLLFRATPFLPMWAYRGLFG